MKDFHRPLQLAARVARTSGQPRVIHDLSSVKLICILLHIELPYPEYQQFVAAL
jgi:hypothetical protein